MKKYLLLLFCSTTIYSQTGNLGFSSSLVNFKKTTVSIFLTPKNSVFVQNLDLKFNSNNQFQVYDHSHSMMDFYSVSNDKFVFEKKLHVNPPLLNVTDSLNPYGVTNISDGILLGVVNTLITDFFKL